MAEGSPGILLSAPKSGSGKTLITCALLQAVKDRGLTTQAFKCGPDYIDPMFHRQIIGVGSKNLDPYFCDGKLLKSIYCEEAEDRDIAILEGAMGLYDGLGGVSEEASAYEVAKILHLPVVLIVDAHGMGRSIIPVLSGLLRYDTENLIRGVILNRTSKDFYFRIAPVMEQELALPVFGYFPNVPEFTLDSRHLGLKLPNEIAGLMDQTKCAAKILEECVQVDKLLETANVSGTVDAVHCASGKDGERETEKVRIAVAADEAFCFYYEDNLKLLEDLGAELVSFSPLHDEGLPENIGGLILGGGYPELYAGQLEQNARMRKAVREALSADMPSLAECGGFLYLHEHLIRNDKTSFKMCGVVPGDCFDTGRLVRFGYIFLTEKNPAFLGEGETLRGHEFHYYDSSLNGSACTAKKPLSDQSWDCVHESFRHWWGFPHLFYLSNRSFAQHFIGEARKYQCETAHVRECEARSDRLS